jgi:hypothetical protein
MSFLVDGGLGRLRWQSTCGQEIAVPAQQRRWRNKKGAPRPARQQLRARRQHPVPVAQIGPVHPAAQHGYLMPEREDLDLLGPGHRARAGSGTEGYGRGSGTGQTRARAARMSAIRTCPSHGPATQQHRSGFSHPTGVAGAPVAIATPAKSDLKNVDHVRASTSRGNVTSGHACACWRLACPQDRGGGSWFRLLGPV